MVACGRYFSSYPNAHPHTVTEATYLNTLIPNLNYIRCLFFISKEPVPNIIQLDMTHCLNENYVLANQPLSQGVYECGKSYGDFSRQDRGSRYLRKLCPNLKYLKLSYPHVSWEDKSQALNIERELDTQRLRFISSLRPTGITSTCCRVLSSRRTRTDITVIRVEEICQLN